MSLTYQPDNNINNDDAAAAHSEVPRQDLIVRHLDWSAKQGRILTDSGNALRYYSQENGFPFVPSELPHHHMERGDSGITFKQWARIIKEKQYSSPIVGAWDRPLFAGRWEHTTNDDEIVYNIQTRTLFVDLRIPKSKPVKKWEKMLHMSEEQRQLPVHDFHRSRGEVAFQSMSGHDLRMFARQHIFGGFSLLSTMESDMTMESPMEYHRSLLCCTRHHCIDWNYVPGKPRPRPNKWYIDMLQSKDDDEYAANSNTTSAVKSFPCNFWKELSYSTDENRQCYYYETWKRRIGDGRGVGLRLAMRRKTNRELDVGGINNEDGIIVVVGDHFNYILGRKSNDLESKSYPHAASLVELVDSAIEHGDRETALSYLSLDGGHGIISSGWKIDCSIQSWNHGLRVFDLIGGGSGIRAFVESGGNSDFLSWDVTIGHSSWDILESSIDNAIELEKLLNHNGHDNISCSRL